MGKLACPSCGEGGRGTFEGRGVEPTTGDSILRCAACLSGMTVKSGPGLPRRKARLIDPETWRRMETAWTPEPVRATTTAPDPIEDPAQLVLALRAQGFGGETLTHLVAETLGKSPVEAALLIAEASGPAVA